MFLIINILSCRFHVDYFQKSESSFFDPDMFGKISNNRKILYFLEGEQEKVAPAINSEIEKLTHLLIIKDNRINLCDALYKVAFVGNIDYRDNPLSNQYLTKQINKIVKNFRSISGLFNNGDDIELLRLPFINFNSDLYKELPEIIKNSSSLESFQDEFNARLAVIRKRYRKPKRRSENKRKFFMDEDEKYFELGKENHSRHETGSPHDVFCNLKAHLRFGHKLDEKRHFNVSYDEANTSKINADYLDCHKRYVPFKKRVHLNIFSNDFIT